MKRYLYFYVGMVLTMMLGSCDGTFDGIYDDAVDDGQQQQGFQTGGDGSRYQISLDARSYDHWYYIDLHNRNIDTVEVPKTLTGEWDGESQRTYYNVHGSVYTEQQRVKVDTQKDAASWDIAIHHFDMKTNGGAALETAYSSIDEAPETSDAFVNATFTADEWSMHQCIVDFTGMMSYNIWYTSSMVNMVLSRWVSMDFSTPPPVYSASQKVYVLRMKDGTYAALRLINYMSDRGTKGYLTIDVKYPY